MEDTEPLPGFAIRPAVRRDATTILEFINEYATYLRATADVKVNADTLTDLLFKQKRAEAAVLEIGGEPVGYCLYYVIYSSFSGESHLFLEDVFLRRSSRGKGLGKQVFRYLSNICSDKGYRGIVWKCRKTNAPAISFCQSLGAVQLTDFVSFELKNDNLDRLLER